MYGLKWVQEGIAPTVEEWARLCLSLGDDVINSYGSLQQLMTSHGTGLREKWQIMSAEEKTTVILSVRPAIPKERPFLGGSVATEDDRAVPLLALQLNIEDLITVDAVPMFLDSRARHSPGEFIFKDSYDCRLGPPYLNRTIDNYAVVVDRKIQNSEGVEGGKGEKGEEKGAYRYGQWVPRAEIVRGTQIQTLPPHVAVPTLHLQVDIMDFVLKLSKTLLGDKFGVAVPTEPCLAQPQRAVGEGASAMMLKIARKAPYGPPTPLDFSRIEAIVSAESGKLKEHLDLLDDPDYLRAQLEDYYEHLPAQLRGRHGKPRTIGQCEQGQLLTKAYQDLLYQERYTSDLLFLLSVYLVNLQKQLENFSPSEIRDLPQRTQTTIYAVRKMTWLICWETRERLANAFYASPKIRKFWYRKNDRPRITREGIEELGKREIAANAITQRLFKRFERIKIGDRPDYLYDDVIELYRFLDKEPDARELLSPHVAILLSRLSVVSECAHHVRTLSRWTRGIESQVVEETKTADARKEAKSSLTSMEEFRASREAIEKGHRNHTVVARTIEKAMKTRTSCLVDRKESDPNTTPNSNPAVTFKHDPSVQITGTFPRGGIVVDVKTKTTGPSRPPAACTAPPETSDFPEQKQHFVVNQRSYKVFSKLFGHSKGQIRWTEFESAMRSVGFDQSASGGSVWKFGRKEEEGKSICFHKPHPNPKIKHNTARVWGRDLHRQYRWTLDNFSEKKVDEPTKCDQQPTST